MQLDSPLDWIPDLKSVIEYSPLIVTPETPLLTAIKMISQACYPTCLPNSQDYLDRATIADEDPLHNANQSPQLEVRSSCVLVKQDHKLVGILTARDVVKITAQEIDLSAARVADFMTSPIITMPKRSIEDLFAALFLFRRYQIRHLPLVDDNGELIGVISHESIRHILRPANLLRFRRVADVMTKQIIHASLDTSILELVRLMAENRVSCVVITQTDEDGIQRPIGIVTERDIVQFHAFEVDMTNTKAQTVMSTPLFLLNPEDSLWTAHEEMKRLRVGRMVVSWDWGQGLGIVTQTSLLRIFDPMEMYGVIENMQQTIQQISPVINQDKDHQNLDEQFHQKSRNQDFVLNDVYYRIKNLVDHLNSSKNISEQEQRSQLNSIIEILEPFKK